VPASPEGSRPVAPVDDASRIGSLDVLRGFALLGILVMNIQSFSMIGAAYINPTAYGDLTGANYWVWLLSHLLADQKFISLFSMLFGAGIVLMTTKAEQSGVRPATLHFRRMGWLILFGLFHGYLLWSGDILFAYGMCGLFLYLFRKMSPGPLFAWAFVFLAAGSAISLALSASIRSAPDEALVGLIQDFWKPDEQTIAAELAAYRGGWLAQLPIRAEDSLFWETYLFLTETLWKVSALMLVGMALFKLGVLSGRRSTGVYVGLVALGAIAGVPIVAYGVSRNFAAGWDLRYSFFFGIGSQFNYWGSVLVALGWVGLVTLAWRSDRLAPATRGLGAVGRMAFTNYILQTVICTTIFYGHGFGLFGRVERVGQVLIVFAVWAVQLAISPVWLRHFQFGPLEWLWRSLTYGCRQPIRAQSPSALAVQKQ
jgi:uncharacterized protein